MKSVLMSSKFVVKNFNPKEFKINVTNFKSDILTININRFSNQLASNFTKTRNATPTKIFTVTTVNTILWHQFRHLLHSIESKSSISMALSQATHIHFVFTCLDPFPLDVFLEAIVVMLFETHKK